MKLRDMFNAKTAEEQNYFDRLEEAYKALRDQKRMLRDGQEYMMRTNMSLASWQTAALKAVSASGKPLPAESIGASVIAGKQTQLRTRQAEMIGQVATTERVLAVGLNEVFKGPDAKEKMAEFFGTGNLNVSDALKAKARGSYGKYEAGIALDDETAVKDIAAKVAKPGRVTQQIKKLNALVDGGNPLNKVRRIAWQLGQRFS